MFLEPFVDFRTEEAEGLSTHVMRDVVVVGPGVDGTLRRVSGKVFAQFLHIHPRRESAIGGKVFSQGLQGPDFFEKRGNRRGQVVEGDSFF